MIAVRKTTAKRRRKLEHRLVSKPSTTRVPIVHIVGVGLFGFFIFLFPPSMRAYGCCFIFVNTLIRRAADAGTRFSSIITLFLALMAVQFVVNAELPASSYALPTQQFIIVRVAFLVPWSSRQQSTSLAGNVCFVLLPHCRKLFGVQDHAHHASRTSFTQWQARRYDKILGARCWCFT